MLATFVRHPNQVLSRDQLRELVWGDAAGMSRDQVKLYVGYLRRKLGWEVGRTRRSRPCAGSATSTGRTSSATQAVAAASCSCTSDLGARMRQASSTSSSSWAGSIASKRTST